MLSLPPTPPTEACIEPVQANLIEDMSWFDFPQPLLSWYGFHNFSINTKLAETVFLHLRVNVIFMFLHLTTFKARFLHLRLELFFTFVVEGIFTIEGDFYK